MLHITALFLLLNSLLWSINAETGHVCLHKTDTRKLTLPWGTYEAEPYGQDGEVSEYFFDVAPH